MKIVIIGAHPDDPEAACGGLTARAIAEGHKVDFVYATNGNKGGTAPAGKSLAEARELEARAAAAVCGVTPYFLGYGDQEIPFDPTSLKRMSDVLAETKPDLILCHWPGDYHQDHQVCGILGTQCIKKLENVGLAYFEACVGPQTFGMTANRYFDITGFVEDKKRMVYCHETQSPDNFWWRHETAHKLYGFLGNVESAEGYMLHVSTPQVEEFFQCGKQILACNK